MEHLKVFATKLSDILKKNSNENKYTLFYSPMCPASLEAIDILKQKNIGFKAYDVKDYKDLYLASLRLINIDDVSLKMLIQHNTKPIIFSPDNRFVGGCDELKMSLK